MPETKNTAPLIFQHQPDAYLDQAAPVQNTWYTVLDTVKNAVVYMIVSLIATTNETIEMRLTVDGNVITAVPAAYTADSNYYARISGLVAGNIVNSTTLYNLMSYGPLFCRSVKVEIRKTTAAGAGNLSCRVFYGKIP